MTISTTRSSSFRRIHLTFFVSLAGLLFLSSVRAQQADVTATGDTAVEQKTNTTNFQVEETNKTSKSSDDDSYWEWDDSAAHGVRREAVVTIRRDARLNAGDVADAVVAVGGSSTALGDVRDSVVAIAGDAQVEGRTEQAIAVFGQVNIGQAARVGRDVISVFGDAKIKKGAKIRGDVISVFGKTDIEEGAEIHGRVHEVDVGPFGVQWLRGWFRHCFLLMRPLAPQVGWVWVIAFGLLAFYFVIAALFPRPVLACVNELTRRPATTFFMGLLTKLLFLPILLILSATGVGLLVSPFILAALVVGAIVGKVALLQFIGLKIGKHSNTEALHHPLIGLLIGAIIITLLYLVPFVGILTLAMAGIWGLGGAVVAAFGGMRREAAEKAAQRKAAAPTSPTGPTGPGQAVAAQSVAAENPNPAGGAGEGTVPPVAGPALRSAFDEGGPSGLQAPVTDALAYPRAGFWERMCAAFLDMVIVGILAGLTHVAPLGLLIAVAYFAGMWAWKQTTIGGIVIGLKVVRIDGGPFTFVTAIVRALAAIFSVIVFFFGFIWIGWDVEKQGWHDKIAGTVVVRLPRGVPLVCF